MLQLDSWMDAEWMFAVAKIPLSAVLAVLLEVLTRGL